MRFFVQDIVHPMAQIVVDVVHAYPAVGLVVAAIFIGLAITARSEVS
jgi:hypothetical protein